MKTVKGTVLCFISISIAVAALGCGNAINGASNGWGDAWIYAAVRVYAFYCFDSRYYRR